MEASATPFVFFGARGVMGAALLAGLLRAGRRPTAVVVPGAARSGFTRLPAPAAPTDGLTVLPVASQQSLIDLAWQAGMTVVAVGCWDGESLGWLAAQQAMLGVVACWPARLPIEVLRVPSYGIWNVHPSRLPEYRGPAPFFWQRRDGLTESALTLHRMSDTLDGGPIVGQRPLPLPDGATDQALDQLAGQAALPMVVEGLAVLEEGTLTTTSQPPGGSYQSWPREGDFIVPTTWTARRAWNFMRVAQVWGVPFLVRAPLGEYELPPPSGWSPQSGLTQPSMRGDQVVIPFAEGEVWWRVVARAGYATIKDHD